MKDCIFCNLDREILVEKIGRLSKRTLEQVEQGLQTVLEL